jgi:hypothetical protein
MTREKVSRLRQLLSEAVPAPSLTTGPSNSCPLQAQPTNYCPFRTSDPRRRARQIRNIDRIAQTYAWTREVQRFLDTCDSPSVSALSDDLLDSLHSRMATLESCVQDGCDPPDAPPAR